MRTAIFIAALLLTPLLARAQDKTFEAGVHDAAGRLKERIGDARLAKDKPAPPARASVTTCAPEKDSDPKLYSSDVRWGLSMAEMKALYEKLYASDKRLKNRAYWNPKENRFELPHEANFGGPVAVPEIMLKALVRHIEAAFAKDYIDRVFFPDMGHSHLLIPDHLYTSKYDKYPTEKRSQFYTDVLSDPEVHIFYHTAEQLQSLKKDGAVLDAERIKWRHHTRNIGGPITETAELTVYQNPESKANTVADVPGFRWWGAGFNLSSNKDGCFSFTQKGETVRFDISLDDLGADPAKPIGDGDY